ncbi:DUF3908 family protein [Virgibacillus oceani]
MTTVNVESYFKSFGDFIGLGLQDQINGFEERTQGLKLIPKEDTFYAKGFFQPEIADKLYFFNQSRMKVVEIETGRKNYIENIIIREYKYNQLENVLLKVSADTKVNLSFGIQEEVIEFNNTTDSGGNWINPLGKQIIQIHNLITN